MGGGGGGDFLGGHGNEDSSRNLCWGPSIFGNYHLSSCLMSTSLHPKKSPPLLLNSNDKMIIIITLILVMMMMMMVTITMKE